MNGTTKFIIIMVLIVVVLLAAYLSTYFFVNCNQSWLCKTKPCEANFDASTCCTKDTPINPESDKSCPITSEYCSIIGSTCVPPTPSSNPTPNPVNPTPTGNNGDLPSQCPPGWKCTKQQVGQTCMSNGNKYKCYSDSDPEASHDCQGPCLALVKDLPKQCPPGWNCLQHQIGQSCQTNGTAYTCTAGKDPNPSHNCKGPCLVPLSSTPAYPA